MDTYYVHLPSEVSDFYYFYNHSSVGISMCSITLKIQQLCINFFIKACARFGQEPNHRLLFILNISVVWVIGKVE